MSEHQPALFTDDELLPWSEHWQNMPEYSLQDLAPAFSVIVHFLSASDVDDFSRALGLDVSATTETRAPVKRGATRTLASVWYPAQTTLYKRNFRYVTA